MLQLILSMKFGLNVLMFLNLSFGSRFVFSSFYQLKRVNPNINYFSCFYKSFVSHCILGAVIIVMQS